MCCLRRREHILEGEGRLDISLLLNNKEINVLFDSWRDLFQCRAKRDESIQLSKRCIITHTNL